MKVKMIFLAIVLMGATSTQDFDMGVIADQYMDYCNVNEIRSGIVYEDKSENWVVKQNSVLTFRIEIVEISENIIIK